MRTAPSAPSARPLASALMRIKRLATLTLLAITALAVLAPIAGARVNGGEGTYGPTTDLAVTYFGFGIIIMFPLLTIVLSILQRRKENREEAAHEAMEGRKDLAEWQGGW